MSLADDIARLFGINAMLTGYGERYNPTVAQADAAGLAAAGGGPLAHDYDYGTSPGQAVKLPQAARFLGDVFEPTKWGHLLYFMLPGGGVFGLPHLENVPALQVGAVYASGYQVGTIGSGAGLSHTYWSGPHLSVIADTKAASYLGALAQGKVPGTAGPGDIPVAGGIIGAGEGIIGAGEGIISTVGNLPQKVADAVLGALGRAVSGAAMAAGKALLPWIILIGIALFALYMFANELSGGKVNQAAVAA